MAINLIELLKGQLGDTLVKQASSFLGESETKTGSAITAILPSLLGTLTKKAESNEGATQIFDLITNGGFDGGLLDNLAGLFTGGESTNKLLDQGNGLIGMLLGDKLGGIVNLISKFSGMGENSSKSLMSMVAPLLMSLLGKQVASGNLNVAGLMDLLKGQGGFIKSLLPKELSGVADLVGFSSMLGNDVKETVSEVTEKAKGGFGRILPWLLLAAAVVAGLYFFRNCQGAAKDAVETAVEQFQTVGTLGENLYKFLESSDTTAGRFTFDKLTFETGSAKITEDSKEQLDNLVTILAKYPNVKIRIEGYTDNTGDAAANKQLSQDRADIVKAYLVGHAIAADRLEAVGYGQENPVADNATEEGKEKNRRVEVAVTAR